MSTDNPLVRDYNFSDLKLYKTAIRMVRNALYDKAEFAKHGYTEASLNDVLSKVKQFSNLPSDKELKANISVITKDKNTAARQLLVLLRSVRTKAKNCFTTKSSEYRSFHFNRMVKLKDIPLYFFAKQVVTVARGLLDELASKGLTEEFLEQILQTAEAFNTLLNDMDKADKARAKATEFRILSGNELYGDLVRISNAGKDLFASTDASRYKRYVIYKSKPKKKSPSKGFGNISGHAADASTGEILEGVAVSIVGTAIRVTTNEKGDFKIDKQIAAPCVMLFEKEGFHPLRLEGVDVKAGKTVPVAVKMVKKE